MGRNRKKRAGGRNVRQVLAPSGNRKINEPSSSAFPSQSPATNIHAHSTASRPLPSLDRLSVLEVEQHLKAPRTQFAFLSDIRRFREEKARRKYLDSDNSNAVTVVEPRRLPSLPTSSSQEQQQGSSNNDRASSSSLPGPSLRSRPRPQTFIDDSPGPAMYNYTPNPNVETYMVSTSAPFTTQDRFPDTSKNVPASYMGSLKTFPILPKPPIPYASAHPKDATTSSAVVDVVVDASSVEAQNGSVQVAESALPVAGVFQLFHGKFSSQSYFGCTWDSKNELERQKQLLRTNTHPHPGLTNRIISQNDLALSDLSYNLIRTYQLIDSFNLEDVQVEMSAIADECRLAHERDRVNRMFKLYWKLRIRQAFPRFFAHTLNSREIERFAAAVELQKVARVYISWKKVNRVREYNREQARLAMMAVMAPVLARSVSKIYRGYKARQRIKVLEQKRRNMRLLIKVQTRLRMILARNRKRNQRLKAAEWRAAKLVQRNWRGKFGKKKFQREGPTALEKFGELKAITENLKKQNDAALKIQDCWRSHTAWMNGPVAMERAIQARNLENAAATTIQARFRGRSGRRKVSGRAWRHTHTHHWAAAAADLEDGEALVGGSRHCRRLRFERPPPPLTDQSFRSSRSLSRAIAGLQV